MASGILGGIFDVAHNPDGTLRDAPLNVKSLGAKGDNATNDTAAIQAVFTAAATAGKAVYVPPGTYLVDNLTAAAGVAAIIAAPGATFKKRAAGTMLSIASVGCLIDGLKIDGNGANFAGIPLQIFSATTDVVISKCTLVGAPTTEPYVIQTNGTCHRLTIKNCRIDGGVLVQQSDAALIDGNRFLAPTTGFFGVNIQSTNPAAGQHSNGARIVNNYFEIPAGMFAIVPSSRNGAEMPKGTVIANNAMVAVGDCFGGISVDTCADCSVVGNTFRVFSGTPNTGALEIAASTNVTATGNDFDGGGVMNTLVAVNNSSDCTIAGNTFRNPSTTGNTVTLLKFIANSAAQHCSRNIVANNKFYNPSGGNGMIGLGPAGNATAFIDETLITGNSFFGNASSRGIILDGTAAVGSILRTSITNNHFVTLAQGIRFFQDDQTTISNNRWATDITVRFSQGGGSTNVKVEGNDWQMATVVPSTHSHFAGERVFHSVPSVGQPVGWICTATGTPGTWVAMPDLSTTPSVKAFGATGDGSTDDTTAIGAARDAAGVGGTVIFPPGTYMVHSVFMTKANQTWIIQPGAMLKSTAVNAQGVVIAVSAAGCKITGGGIIDGNGANVTSDVTGIYGVNSSSTDLTVEGVTIQNCKGSAFSASASRTKIRFCKITNSPTTSVASIPCVQIAPTGSDIYGVEVVDNTVDLSALAVGAIKGAGIFVGGTPRTAGQPLYDFNVHQARIHGNEVILPTSPTTAGGSQICISFGCLQSSVIGNTTRGGAMGVSADSTQQSIVSANNIYGCISYGIECASSSRLTISGNNIDGAGLTGGGYTGSEGLSAIEMTGIYASSNVTITNNTIYNLIAATNAIGVNTGSQHVVTANNVSGSNGGIVVAATDTTISNNIVAGTSAGGSRGIRFVNTVGRSTVSGNTINGWARGVEFSPTSVTQDNISLIGNIFVSTAAPIFDGKSGSGVLGAGIKLSGNSGIEDFLDWKNLILTANVNRLQRFEFGVGSIVENFPAAECRGTGVPGVATRYGSPVYLFAGEVITGNWFRVSATGTNTGGFVGLYSYSAGVLTRVAVTADTTTAWNSVGLKKNAWTAPYTVPTSGIYYVMFIVVGGTAPTLFQGSSSPNAQGTPDGTHVFCIADGTGGPTTMPASYTLLSVSQTPAWHLGLY